MFMTSIFLRQVKCEKYWPDESGIYGDISVTTTETRTFADYVTRVFILKKVKLPEINKILNIIYNYHKVNDDVILKALFVF